MALLRKKLKNGMTVLMEKRELPVVSFCIANKIGAALEEERVKGIAHFMEHLLFTGTKTRTHEDISKEIEKRGGILNAFTAQEVTSFWFKLPSEHIESGMDILADILNNSVMNEEKFEKEKKVVIEEIKMYHDNPRAHVMEMAEQGLYESPFGIGIIGTKESVSGMKRNFVHEYYKKMYCPSNFVAVVVGNADFKKVCDKLEKAFQKKAIEQVSPRIMLKNEDKYEEREGIDQAHLTFSMHAPLAGTNENYAMQLLNMHLAGGMSSKLFLEIRENRGLAYTVRGEIYSEKSYAYCTIYVGTRKDAIDEVKKLIIEGFKKAEKMTQQELDDAKERLIGLKRVSSEESNEVMNNILMHEIAGRAEDYYDFEDKVKAVKLEDVRKLAKLGKYSFAAVVPK